MLTVMLAAMALLADATPAAAPAAQAAPAPAAPAADANTETVCHKETNVGELVPRKVCVTRLKKSAPSAQAKAETAKAAKPN